MVRPEGSREAIYQLGFVRCGRCKMKKGTKEGRLGEKEEEEMKRNAGRSLNSFINQIFI